MKIRRSKKSLDAPRRRTSLNDEANQPTKQAFRLGRTLTGSSSAHVASSNELHADLRSPRSHIHHLNRYRRHLFGKLVLVLLLIAGVYGVASQLIATSTVTVSGGSAAAPDRNALYQRQIEAYLSSHPFERLYPNVRQANLLHFVEAKYPEVKSLSMQLTPEFGKTHTTISLRQPVAQWKIGENNEYVDENGVVFSYSPGVAPSITVVDQSGLKSDKTLVSQQFLAFVGSIVGDLQHYGYHVQTVTIPNGAIRQIDIQIENLSYRFKLSIDRSAGNQAEDIARIVPYLKAQKSTPQYVDVRVPGKAFYQ